MHITESGQSKCKRCGKWFTPTKDGQEYGEKCMRKMAGQTILQDRYVVPPRKKRQKARTETDKIELNPETYRMGIMV